MTLNEAHAQEHNGPADDSAARVDAARKPKAPAGSRRRRLSGRLEGLLQAPAEKDDPAAAQRLAQWLRDKRNVVVLTGAGLSTDSGIPDYRGKAGSYRLGHVPIGHDEFHAATSATRRGADTGRGRWSAIPPLQLRNPTMRTSQLLSLEAPASSTR